MIIFYAYIFCREYFDVSTLADGLCSGLWFYYLAWVPGLGSEGLAGRVVDEILFSLVLIIGACSIGPSLDHEVSEERPAYIFHLVLKKVI